MRRILIRGGIILAAFFIFCSKSQAQVIELACPLGTSSVQALQTTDTVTGKLRQNYCVDIFGNVFENITGTGNICVTNGFNFSAIPTCYATVQAAITAACAQNPVGTVTIPPGTYTGPTTFCSNLTLMGLTGGEARPQVGNLGVTPLTAVTPITLTYSSTLTLTSLQRMSWSNIMLDFGSCSNCSFIMSSSSFNVFNFVTLNNVGDTGTGQAALLITVNNGTGSQFGSVWNSFDHLRINCNGATNHYCYAAVELLGAGSVNVAPAAFATLNTFYDLGVTGQYKYCIDAELNSDTNYFWHVDCNENTNGIANSAVLAFNLNTPGSDQDADGGQYYGVIVAGFGPASFIRAGQSNGNIISISQGSSGLPTLTLQSGCTQPACQPLYTIQNIGLPGVNGNFYVGGTLYSLGSMNPTLPTTVAGDIVAARGGSTTQGGFFGGTDGASFFRSGLLWTLGGSTVAGLGFNEQAQSACGSAQDALIADQVAHQLKLCNNAGALMSLSQVVTTSLTTTAAASDNVTVTGMTTTGHCYLTPTNASAATNIATTFVSAKAANQITVSHSVTAGMTYDVVCSPQ